MDNACLFCGWRHPADEPACDASIRHTVTRAERLAKVRISLAQAALTGLLANGDNQSLTPEQIAARAFTHADAMLKAGQPVAQEPPSPGEPGHLCSKCDMCEQCGRRACTGDCSANQAVKP